MKILLEYNFVIHGLIRLSKRLFEEELWNIPAASITTPFETLQFIRF